MIEIRKFLERRREQPSLLKAELSKVRKTLERRSGLYFLNDPYLEGAEMYLEWALRCGLGGQAIIDSCYDLALLKDEKLALAFNREKIEAWEKARKSSLAVKREPTKIQMQLYPEYFAAILSGRKTHEGRAYDPQSEKAYHDIRQGDLVVFSICQEFSGWEDDCRRFDLKPNMIMATQVADILFAPTVHWMYQYCPCVGEEFQPMINGPSELLYLQRAAVYYSFPGYKERIRNHGFVGIRLEKPRLE